MIEHTEPSALHAELLLLCDTIAEQLVVLGSEVTDMRQQSRSLEDLIRLKEDAIADLKRRLSDIRNRVHGGMLFHESLPVALLRGAK